MQTRAGVMALLAALGCAATQSRPPAVADAAGPSPLRAVGRSTLIAQDYVATFQIAMLTDRQGRSRLDLVLPTGMSAAILWLHPDRWLLLDPAANVAWHGAMREALEIISFVPESYRAALVLGMALGSLNGQGGFGKISPPGETPASAPEFAFTATDYSGTVDLGATRWQLTLTGRTAGDGIAWPAEWRITNGSTVLEVEWRNIETLTPAELRLLEPRVPASFSARSWRSWSPPAAPAADPSGAAATPVPTPTQVRPPGPERP